MIIVSQYLFSALGQILFVIILSSIFYCLGIFLLKKNMQKQSFFQFLGLNFSKSYFDKTFLSIFISLLIFAVISTAMQFHYSDELRKMITSDSSPYFKILSNGLGLSTIIAGLIYSLLQSGFAEELLFRGLIAPRLVSRFGFAFGNIIQALIFWLMHLIIFKLITGFWFSRLQVFAFVTSFILGLLLGYVNFKDNKVSIIPSWILHGSINFSTFMTLAFLL